MAFLFSFFNSPLGKGTAIGVAVLFLFGVYQCKQKIEFKKKTKANIIKLQKKKVEDQKVLKIYENQQEIENKAIPEVKELPLAEPEKKKTKEQKLEDKKTKEQLKKEVFEEMELLR